MRPRTAGFFDRHHTHLAPPAIRAITTLQPTAVSTPPLGRKEGEWWSIGGFTRRFRRMTPCASADAAGATPTPVVERNSYAIGRGECPGREDSAPIRAVLRLGVNSRAVAF